MKTLTEWLFSLNIYLRMSFFASSPSSLPYSPSSLVLSVMAYLLVGNLLLSEIKSLLSILLQIFIEIGIFVLISYFMLGLKNRRSRLLQTVSALIGVNLVISLISLIVVSQFPDYQSAESIDPLLLKLNLLILLWNLAVISLIFKRAFEIKTITAGFIAFNYLLLYEFILLNFF